MQRDDANLVERCLAGEEGAYAILLERHRDAVYTMVRHMVRNPDDAAEITQDAFVRAFHALARFDPQYTFRAWILRIASNQAIDFLRKRRPKTVSFDEPLEGREGAIPREFASGDPGPDAVIAEADEVRLVEWGLTQLSPAHRQVLLLLSREQLSYEEIAALLEEPIGTVKARIHRAREALRVILAPYLGEPEGRAAR